jgi:hypothetical protein
LRTVIYTADYFKTGDDYLDSMHQNTIFTDCGRFAKDYDLPEKIEYIVSFIANIISSCVNTFLDSGQ